MQEPINARPARWLELSIGTAVGIIAAGLMAFLIGLFTAISDFSQLQSPFSAVVTLAFSIALVFVVVAWRTFFRAPQSQETMSLAGWRYLAWSLVAFGFASGLLLHWAATIPPLIIAAFCCLKDPSVSKWLLLIP